MLKRINLKLKELMFEQQSYDTLYSILKDVFVNFDLNKFESHLLSSSGSRMTELNLKILLKDELNKLDKIKPLNAFNEKGKHYAFELFITDPKKWDLKGELYLWAYIAREFSDDLLPISEHDLIYRYLKIIGDFDIPFGSEEYTNIEKFNYDGKDAGIVCCSFVTEGLDVLLERLKMYNLFGVVGNAERSESSI